MMPKKSWLVIIFIQVILVVSASIVDGAVATADLANNSVTIDKLAVTDGNSGQVLTTDGSGTLSFTTVEDPTALAIALG